MNRLNEVYKELKILGQIQHQGASAYDIAEKLNIDRSTASRYLNELVKKSKAIKIPGKPVRYKIYSSFHGMEQPDWGIRVGKSLQPILKKAMAAFLYPSKSLPILITGETGTGKTFLAEILSKVVNKKSNNKKQIPFITFNCADYANNPELLIGQIFGIKEEAFTGATKSKIGLVERAKDGILFLDEIHRLPPSGQEMLFYLMDKGMYRRLGETTRERYSNVTLIGATTEDPNRALLPTLNRRFSVKLTLPPLKERSREEREELLEQFLNEEKNKMNTNLFISNSCREFLLTYECPGNIGQLKSDIQIACARAYLRFLNNEEDCAIIKEEDLSSELTDDINEKASKHKSIKKVEKKDFSFNLDQSDPLRLPNIYEQLNKINKSNPLEVTKGKLQKMIQEYVQILSQKYKPPQFAKKGWQQLIDEDLLHALNLAYHQLKNQLPISIDRNQLYVLGLHLQNYRNHSKNNPYKESLPAVIHPNIKYRESARQLAAFLEKNIQLHLPKEEIELMAFFLTSERSNQRILEQSIAVILVTHGDSTASSMAHVTNTLLGNEVIHAIDMPLDISVNETYEQVKQEIKKQSNGKGVLLLVDLGSLVTMGDTIQHEVDIPIKTLSNVNLSIVLEAGRKSLVIDRSLDEIYEELKKIMFASLNNDTQTTNLHKKRLIATVCFTGEGASQLLEIWIKKYLSRLDQDVVVRTVRIDPTTKDTTVLNELKNYYDVVAIIGTVPVSIRDVPFIPAWELLQKDGISRMEKLLELTRNHTGLIENQDIPKSEFPQFILQGLGEIVTYVNPKIIVNILEEYMPPIQSFFQWDNTRELGIWMHIGSLMDRILSAKLNHTIDQFQKSIPIDQNIIITKEEEDIWSELLLKLESTFKIKIPAVVKRELIRLSK